MSKVYRTARGESVDKTVLLSKNEREPALGNMRVNARGDEIDPDGNIVKSRSEIMQEYYNLDTMIPEDGEIPESSGNAYNSVVEDEWVDWEPQSHQGQQESEDEVAKRQGTNIGRMIEEQTGIDQEERKPSGGLAAAVAAKKKIVTNDVQKTEAQQDRENKGVRRI